MNASVGVKSFRRMTNDSIIILQKVFGWSISYATRIVYGGAFHTTSNPDVYELHVTDTLQDKNYVLTFEHNTCIKFEEICCFHTMRGCERKLIVCRDCQGESGKFPEYNRWQLCECCHEQRLMRKSWKSNILGMVTA